MASFTIPVDIVTGRPHKQVHVLLIPTATPWHIPAILGLGGWNECPFAEHHCARWRRWESEYGATPVGVSGDVVEFAVSDGPDTRDGAIALARQQFAYCEDLVFQGYESIMNLAAHLKGARTWYFWWD